MEISSEEKATLKLKINPLLEPYLAECEDNITTTPPYYFAGNYLNYEIQKIKYDEHTPITYGVVYAIVPNKSLKVDDYALSYPNLPEGYMWANNVYYYPATGFTNTPGK